MVGDDETAYAALAAAVDDARWAFGTGFSDPLAGVDRTVPPGVDGDALATYCVMLADDGLVLSHRLQEWVTRLPDLEEEAAVANIALDLLGQSRRLYSRAGQADGSGRDEDGWAFDREPQEWRCVRLVQPPIEDFAGLVARAMVFAAWRWPLARLLAGDCADPVLAAICAQAAKELAYHLDWAAGWVVRLGDGTAESRRRAQAALDGLWPWVPELFDDHPIERALPDVAVPASQLGPAFHDLVDPVLADATLDRPAAERIDAQAGRTGRDGGHTEHLARLVAELQSVARADPAATW